MVFRRKGRPSLYFQGQTQTGWKQISTGTSNRTLANKIVALWDTLADAREWDILHRVVAGSLTVGALYDAWAAAKDVKALRRNLEDVDVGQFTDEFLAVYRRGVQKDSAEHVAAHLVALFGNEMGEPMMRSLVTTALLSRLLNEYAGKRNTLRKVHSSWSVYFQYLTDVKGLFESNPMDKVERPKVERSPIRYYELAAVQRIIEAQPNNAYRPLYALLYGTGIEVSVALGLTRADVFPEHQEVRAAGTKTHSRDRMARVADWAWPMIERHVRDKLPQSRLFGEHWTRWVVSKRHRETAKQLGLPVYPLHNARDHWAVRQLKAGAPVAMVAAQLGHGSPQLTLSKYGRFIPSAADRAHWEAEATKSDRRSAKGSAKMKLSKLSNSRGGT